MGVDESEGVGAHATTAVGVSWAQAQAGGWLYGEAAYVSASSSAILEAEAGERRASVNVRIWTTTHSHGAESVGLWCARSGPDACARGNMLVSLLLILRGSSGLKNASTKSSLRAASGWPFPCVTLLLIRADELPMYLHR